MLWELFIFLFFFALGCWLSLSVKRMKQMMEWDPFGFKQYLTTVVKCEKCGWTKSRYWVKGDFIGKEVVNVRAVYPKSLLGKHKQCNGGVFITAIYWERKMDEKEQKYNKLCRKWGNKDGIYI